ncbi:MAG: hypothetical protein JNL82_33975 [Myxococcales bacterium]|nr:hypothetical protein [Myxococcales bacterium]
MLALMLAAACGPEAADESATEPGPTSSGADSTGTDAPTTGEPTTGEPPPAVDCAEVPVVLDAPVWTGEPANGGGRVAAAADGDVLLLRTGVAALEKFGVDGVAWSHTFADDESPVALAALADGRVVVGGMAFDDDAGRESRLWLFGADGQLLAVETVDHEPGRDEHVVAMGASPAGHVAAAVLSVAVEGDPDARLRVDRYDDALALVWSADGGAYEFDPALDVDADGRVYLATARIAGTSNGGFDYTWELRVRSFDADGERWAADPVEVETDNNVLALAVSVGDQVYVLGQRPAAFFVGALTTAGAPVWAWTRDQAEAPSQTWLAGHRLGALAASPCGGVYLGGYSDVDIDGVAGAASLFHVAPDGTPGPVTNVLETPHDGQFAHSDVSALDVALGRIVAVGSLEPVFPNDAPSRTWVRSF